jgi:pimeloyl-ACP methyl ester carboxylesterase
VTGVSPSPATDATDAGRLRRVVSADGTTIVLERVTDGEHDLLLVPGGPSRRSRWAAVAAGLAGRWSCWLVDRRGKGDSGDTAPYALEREYEDLAAAVVSFPRPVALAGHSSGAICVLGAAALVTPAALVLYEPPFPVGLEIYDPGVVARLEALLAAGDPERALLEVAAAVAETPLRERLWSLRMLAQHRLGRTEEALRSYRQVRAVLRDELGLEPGCGLRTLHARMLAEDPTLAGPSRALTTPA